MALAWHLKVFWEYVKNVYIKIVTARYNCTTLSAMLKWMAVLSYTHWQKEVRLKNMAYLIVSWMKNKVWMYNL